MPLAELQVHSTDLTKMIICGIAAFNVSRYYHVDQRKTALVQKYWRFAIMDGFLLLCINMYDYFHMVNT
ncbi:hypothetical protein [Ralstonia phage RP13]|nr:hypothetical protein [Ralstonia phage RP13]